MSETELIEERLRDFPSVVDDSDWGEVLRRAAGRGRPSRRRSRRLALAGIGVLATAGAIAGILVVVLGGAGAQNAFAGWTAAPTAPARGQTAGALSKCTARLAGVAAVAAADWQPLVTDTRGPFTVVILQGPDATATCLTGPSFTTAAVTLTQAGGSLHVVGVGAAHGGPPIVSVLAPDDSAPIKLAEQEQTSVDGRPYTLLQGQIQPGETGATFLLSDGSRVQATVADGSIAAWWPSNARATAAELTGGSGLTTQQLAFTPISRRYTFTPISGQSSP